VKKGDLEAELAKACPSTTAALTQLELD